MAEQLSYYKGNRSFEDVVREEFAFSLIFNNIAPAKMAAALKSVGLQSVPNAFLLLQVDDDPDGSKRFSVENEFVAKPRILDLVRTQLKTARWDHMAANLTGTDNLIVFFCIKEEDGCEEELSRLSRELSEQVRRFTDHTVSICSSGLCAGTAQLSCDYERARARLREASLLGKKMQTTAIGTAVAAADERASELLGRLRARSTDSAFRETVQQYIKDHYNEKLYLEEIAASCGYSKYYFCRQFKKCFGIGLSESVNRYRVERAKELMREGSLSVEEVAREVGFSSANYFEIVFRKSAGVSPTVYRKIQGGKG